MFWYNQSVTSLEYKQTKCFMESQEGKERHIATATAVYVGKRINFQGPWVVDQSTGGAIYGTAAVVILYYIWSTLKMAAVAIIFVIEM